MPVSGQRAQIPVNLIHKEFSLLTENRQFGNQNELVACQMWVPNGSWGSVTTPYLLLKFQKRSESENIFVNPLGLRKTKLISKLIGRPKSRFEDSETFL